MATLPKLQILYRREGDILFGWTPQPTSEISKFNLYQSSTPRGTFYKIAENIANVAMNGNNSQYSDKVTVLIKDIDIPITDNTTHYFKLTYFDLVPTESDIADSPVIPVYPAGVRNEFQNDSTDIYSYKFGWNPETHQWQKIRTGSQLVTLFDSEVVNDGVTHTSPNVNVDGANKITFYTEVTKTLAPTNVQLSVEGAAAIDSTFIKYTDVAGSGKHFDSSVNSGTRQFTVAGNEVAWIDSSNFCARYLRAKLDGSGTDATNYFTCTVKMLIQY